MPTTLGGEADRAGRELGKKMSDGLAKAVEASSARLTKARRAEVDAAKAVTVAELRLNEAREKGNRPASQLLALENALEKANYKLSQAQSNTVTSTKKLEDAQRHLAASMSDVGKGLGPAAQKAGDDAGGKLALGLRMSIVRNSPLIAAAIGGGLAAGAPLAMTAATGLFAGIGIVAAAQSDKVQSAWLGTWQRIRDGAIADAAVIEPTLVGLADRVGDGFERMRPRLRGIFADVAPQIDVFAGGLLGLVENALPGLERAIARSVPVTQGFADFLEKTGTGLTGFFDGISEHAPAAGEAFSLIGDVIGELLPTLGTLLGQGAELATMVLPPVVSVLGALNGVLDRAGGLLPPVSAGLLALKVADLIGNGIGKLGDKLEGVASSGPRAAAAIGRTGSAMQALNSTAGTAGLSGVLIGLTTYFAQVDAASDKWANAIREGGSAAQAARMQMADFGTAANEVTSGWGALIPLFSGSAGTLAATGQAVDGVTKKLDEQWRAMDPLAQAQSKVAEWSSTLRDRMNDEGTSAGDLEAAKRRLAHWQEEAARLADAESMALRGVTEAMVAQIDQSRAAVDAQFALQLAGEGVEDALARQAELMASGTATADELEDAARDVAMAYSHMGRAASEAATSNLPAALDDQQRAIVGAKAELEYYNGLLASGVDLPQSLDDHVAYLQNVVSGADHAAIEAAILKAKAEEAGVAVEDLGTKEARPTVQLDTVPLSTALGMANTALSAFGGQIAIPQAQLNSSLFAGAQAEAM
ncbi:hypothetical protein E4P40_25455, partial [Blastococcus sp. CT_GayMR20]|uniref:hypothetical protein n=1 Tax=Blastococcus sp. CT_GayMR20 TaxID=2559609 RepID=UPI001074385D